MTISESGSSTGAQVGELHITPGHEPHYADFESIVDLDNLHLARQGNFCILPGDDADDGSAEQYDLIRQALEGLNIPVHLILGDDDRKRGHLDVSYQRSKAAPVASTTTVTGYRCLYLEAVFGGPESAFGQEQLEWRRSLLGSRLGPNRNGRPC